MAKKNVRMLLADDESLFVQMMEDILQKNGYYPDTAFRGDDAIEKVEANNYDVVLTDIRMPGANGLEVLGAAKNKDSDTQVIVISAYGDADNILKALRLGATDFIQKPVEMPVFIPNVVDRAVERRKLLVENRELLSHLSKRNKELEDAMDTIKRQQEELVHGERLKVIGTMAAGLAHEINNPLAFISINVQSMEMYVQNFRTYLESSQATLDEKVKLENDVKGVLQGIKNGVTRVSQITMALRAFSRRDPGELQKVSLRECIENAMNILAPRLKKIKVVTNLEDADFELTVNRQNITHAIMNFMQNSCDALDGADNPELLISTTKEDDHLLLSIKDNGRGMTEDIKESMKDPFFSTKYIGKGAGLGLPISLGIIEESNGNVTFDSSRETGTEVRIRWKIQ